MRKIIIVVFILVFSVGFVSKNTVNTEETKKTKGSIAVLKKAEIKPVTVMLL